jgi:hypothetical protein
MAKIDHYYPQRCTSSGVSPEDYDQVPACLTYSSTEMVSSSVTSANLYRTKHRIACQKIILFEVTVQGAFTAEDSSDPVGYCDLEHLTGYVKVKKKTIIS